MTKYRKAVVAVAGAVVAVLAALDVPVAEGLPEAVVAVVSAVLVYLVPNE